ncbi:hypothetical protein JCM8547_005608 [Rhodosporidiobolus lusitaniae]
MLRPQQRRLPLYKTFNTQTRRSLHDNGIWGYQSPPSTTSSLSSPSSPTSSPPPPDTRFSPADLANRARNASLLRLVESYRRHGHRAARLDPLDLAQRPDVPALDPRRYGFALREGLETKDRSEWALRSEFESDVVPSEEGQVGREGEKFDVSGILSFPPKENGETRWTMEEIAERLAEVYCGGVAYEFSHMTNLHERDFLERLLESSYSAPLSKEEQLASHKLLVKSETFDRFLAKRFPSVKRYGLEGGESMMVAVAKVLEEAQEEAVEDVVIGMPHRGRLNMLTQLLDMDPRLVFRKMRGLPTLPASLPADQFSDDVLSHLFTSTTYKPLSSFSSSSPPLNVHVLPNPSHLETVTPVALGFARGLQVPFGSLASCNSSYELGSKVLSLSIHGDGAWSGQGIVAESLNLATLPHFNVGGTVHVVVNNQLGYTTAATQGRSSFYATDLAKLISSPILHVNGDAPDSVSRAMALAMAFRRRFKKDVVIDLVVYRRAGHNELDEPGFTQPAMYEKIRNLPSVATLYERSLISSQTLTESTAASLRAQHLASLDSALSSLDSFEPPEPDRPRGWHEMRWPEKGKWEKQPETGVKEEVLKEVGKVSVTAPKDFTVHPRLLKMHIAKRLVSLDKGEGIDFATAEALAFGSMLVEGKHVRLCGQDSGRGTFSQRHAILTDQSSERVCVPLQTLHANSPSSAGTFECVNSPLSEYSVMGFEQGVAYVSPDMWCGLEMQFGDFIDTAQVMVDTYLGSGETKWGLQSGLTLLLPHGFDGAGPEHSSARIERFLQLTNEPLHRMPFVPNLHITQVTTAANYFHLIRRQQQRDYRKPLVIATPKGLLRFPPASSPLSTMTAGTSFKPVLEDEPVADPSKVERVVVLSGKLYYDLAKERKERGLDGRIAFIRLEEISPFPYAALSSALSPFSSASSFVWAQDEPENAGAYLFALPRLQQILPKGTKVGYAGRPAMATVAPGVKQYFQEQQKGIVDQVFQGL